MLEAVGASSMRELISEAIPASLRLAEDPDLPSARSEPEVLHALRDRATRNEIWRSYIGLGTHDTVTPGVIRRNVLENPDWYTAYTPYQAEISQGRLEALLNFQTLTSDLTGLPIANASLLDEATAAAEAMLMLHRRASSGQDVFFVDDGCHPQTRAVVETRAEPLGIRVETGDHRAVIDDPIFTSGRVFGTLLQYPTTDGVILDYQAFCERARANDVAVAVAADPLALTLLAPPGEWGADVAVGSTQRLGVPMGYGGPHAAYFATTEEYKREVPGRLIGVSKDADGRAAFRMALQTREQHIRRGKATSNICTAQVLPAVLASMYAVYHGPEGLRRIAERIHGWTNTLAEGLKQQGHRVRHRHVFDTLRVDPHEPSTHRIRKAAEARRINLRYFGDESIGVALNETVDAGDIEDLLAVFAGGERRKGIAGNSETNGVAAEYDGPNPRQSAFLEHETFHTHQSETGLMRYARQLARKDVSLTDGMIPLGSCTMKLNAASQLEPLSWPVFGQIHPLAPAEQTEGFNRVMDELKESLLEITGFDAITLQPGSGATGEYTGLLMIQAYQRQQDEGQRDVCLIPESAHGTNPASAQMAGMTVETVACDDAGRIDLADLRSKADEHAGRLSAMMVTYPSTHGVFEGHIETVCRTVHQRGGQVYLDGANLNAMAGLVRPVDIGADVCHLNLHKTFAVPHGGGGPGSGPVCVREHLAPFLPGHPLAETGGSEAIGPVGGAPHGSPLLYLVSWAYLRLLGAEGLQSASEAAILSANYVAESLADAFGIVYQGETGRVAHEFILDIRRLRREVGVTEQDVAKRLMDYGFHAPTTSWPVLGGLMIEPTESEPKEELDRFCEAMTRIREEIARVETGDHSLDESPLRGAPHTAEMLAQEPWPRSYSREMAAYPSQVRRDPKKWPAVRRIDAAYGDRNLVCTCPPVEAYADAP
jgi:glycine dehydrogenase